MLTQYCDSNNYTNIIFGSKHSEKTIGFKMMSFYFYVIINIILLVYMCLCQWRI